MERCLIHWYAPGSIHKQALRVYGGAFQLPIRRVKFRDCIRPHCELTIAKVDQRQRRPILAKSDKQATVISNEGRRALGRLIFSSEANDLALRERVLSNRGRWDAKHGPRNAAGDTESRNGSVGIREHHDAEILVGIVLEHAVEPT